MRRLQTDVSDTSDDDADIDMTPMLDVVFILLIFFIVTATFVKESGLDLNSPDDDNPPPPKDKKLKSMYIKLTENGKIWIDERSIEVGAVRANVERFHAQNPEGSVVIQTQQKAKSDTLIQVMDQSRQAGVYNISLSPLTEVIR